MRDFKDFCEVDKGLSILTVRLHVWRLRKFLEFIGDTSSISRGDIRAFLKYMKENYAPSYYANFVKTLNVFFRDHLGKGDLVKTFKFPGWIPPKPMKLPTKDELRRFYEALSDIRMKILFLFYATSGLRKMEAHEIRLKNNILLPEMKVEESLVPPYLRIPEISEFPFPKLAQHMQEKHPEVLYKTLAESINLDRMNDERMPIFLMLLGFLAQKRRNILRNLVPSPKLICYLRKILNTPRTETNWKVRLCSS